MKTAKLVQLETELAQLSAEAAPLIEKSKASTLTAEEDARLDQIIERANKIGPEKVAAENQANAASQLLETNNQYNKPATKEIARLPIQGAGSLKESDELAAWALSFGEQLMQSEQFAERNAKGVMNDPVEFKGLFPEYDRYATGPESQRALIYSGTGSTSMVLPQVVPGIFRPGEAPLNIRDVLLNMTTSSDSLTVITESGFTNGAVEVAEATSVAGGAKPESALTFTESAYPVAWIAHWVPITRQMLEDLPMMQGYVDDRLLTGLKRRENAEFLNGNGIAPNITGLLQTSGIQVLDAAYFAGAAVQDAGTDNDNVNRVRRAKRVIQVTGKAQATFAVLNPTDLENIDTISDANRQYLLGGPLVDGPRRLWGLDVVESEDIAAGTILVGDGTMAAVADRQDARIYTTDSHSDYFIRNILVILAEERVALPVFRAAAFAKTTLAAWA